MRLKWGEVGVCEGQDFQTNAIFFSHILDCACVCMQYLPDLSGLEVVCVINHFPSSQCPHNQTFIQNIPTTSWEQTLRTAALLHLSDGFKENFQILSNLSSSWCSVAPFVLSQDTWQTFSSFFYYTLYCCTLKKSFCVLFFCQVPGQAVVSRKHQGWGDMWEVTRPHPETGMPLTAEALIIDVCASLFSH